MGWTKRKRKMIQRHLWAWIEERPLVEAIMDTMEEQLAEASLEAAKKLWLDFLENRLHEGLSSSLVKLVDKGDIKAEPLPF